MATKMPCHISDGPQLPEDVETYSEPDSDQAYEDFRQRKIDDGECMTCNRPHEDGSPWCAECNAIAKATCTICASAWVDVQNGEDTCPDCAKQL